MELQQDKGNNVAKQALSYILFFFFTPIILKNNLSQDLDPTEMLACRWTPC